MDRHGHVVALLDATGIFFEPVRTAFPGADETAWARAALLDPGASVAVQARANAATNPDAMFRDPITVDEVLSS
ncbi:hypothetical protein AB0B44_33950, partial [Streptomyces sp. NPDC041003]